MGETDEVVGAAAPVDCTIELSTVELGVFSNVNAPSVGVDSEVESVVPVCRLLDWIPVEVGSAPTRTVVGVGTEVELVAPFPTEV